jgi:arylformamidase
LSAHTGTHIDAPNHFINDGKTVDEIPLSKLVGPTQVIKLSDSIEIIDEQIIEKMEIQKDIPRILIKTKNSSLWGKTDNFQNDFVYLTPSGAKTLINKGIQLIGIDYLSIASFQDGAPTHRVLLENEVVILEGLNLSDIQPGIYEMICLPLNLIGTDGAPARVILIER